MAIFCTLYYICSYICTAPQVFKLIKTKSSNDYSLWAYAISTIGLICWSLYIFTSPQDIIVYIGTVIDLALMVLVDALILAFYKFKKKGNNEEGKV
ncbi:MAG: SemiSWEET family transporter [Clostridia bacterium]|nr:SemiSWEET family transporter [Clostridia bacterium]